MSRIPVTLCPSVYQYVPNALISGILKEGDQE